MQMPIPQDWDKETWECYQVYFPKSKAYTGILLGFLSAMSRGRFWDGATGNIKEAQAIGWNVFRRSVPLLNCAGENQKDIPGPGEWPCDLSYDLEGMEDYVMGCFVERLECRADGLWMRLCGEWHKVPNCDAFGGFTDDDETIVERPPEESEEDWRCTKAMAIADLLYGIARAALSHWDTINPLSFISNVEGDVFTDLDNRNLLWLYQWMLLNIVVQQDYDELVTDTQKQLFICKLAPLLDGSNNDIGSNQYEIIRTTFKGMAGNNILEQTFLGDVFMTVSLETMRKATRMAPLVLTAQCGCPTLEPEIPVSYTWGHKYNFRLGEYGWQLISESSGRAYILGQGFTNLNMDDEGVGDFLPGIKKAVPSPFAGTTVLYFQLHYTSWPTKTTIGDVHWAGVDGGATHSSSEALYGREYLGQVVDMDVAQGQQMNFGRCNVFGLDTVGGDSILMELVIVGEGTDPWPTDPPL